MGNTCSGEVNDEKLYESQSLEFKADGQGASENLSHHTVHKEDQPQINVSNRQTVST